MTIRITIVPDWDRAAGVALAAACCWVNGVGVIGSEDNDAEAICGLMLAVGPISTTERTLQVTSNGTRVVRDVGISGARRKGNC